MELSHKGVWATVLGLLGLGAFVTWRVTRPPQLAPKLPAGGGQSTMSVSPASEGFHVEETGLGAEAPMVPGERVVFHARAGDAPVGALEGVYEGASDPTEPSKVKVDRLAYAGEVNAVGGRYPIPASKKSGWHTYLERVRWDVLSPSAGDLSGFSTNPHVKVDDKVTLLVRDAFGTKVVAIAQIRKLEGDAGIEAVLLEPYRVLHDEGAGDVVFPKIYDQALVRTSLTNLVDASSIPSAVA